jgi:poly-gamma-glutamate synthesis protein (capsule biosynthesis protein)
MAVLLGVLGVLACQRERDTSGGTGLSHSALGGSQPRPVLPSYPSASATPSGAASATPKPPVPAPVRLAFVGDINLSMLVGQYILRRTHGLDVPDGVDANFPFTAVRERLVSADLAIGNLECVVSTRGKRETKHNPFRAPLEVIPVLREAGFDILSVANNHSRDFGRRGYKDMLKNLTRGGLAPVGGFGLAPREAVVQNVRGTRVAFLAYYNEYRADPVPAYKDVARARAAAEVVVVFNHWGREGKSWIEPMQRQFGRGLIDAGADLVVGTHAHVLQPEEWYRGKLLFYGLGNFVFNAMNFDEAHRTGGYLEVDIDRHRIHARRFYRIRLDHLGAPQWLDQSPRLPECAPPCPDGGLPEAAINTGG